MFDSKEIAERALRRAEAIKTKKRAGRVVLVFVGSALAACAALSVGILTYQYLSPHANPPIEISGDSPAPGISAARATSDIYDADLPLANIPLPDKNAAPYDDPVDGRANGGYIIPAFNRATASAGGADGAYELDIPLFNQKSNRCFISYEITLNESGEIIYASGLIGPGCRIERPQINAPLLTPGEHGANFAVILYDIESRARINAAEMELIIYFEKNAQP